MYSTVRPDPQYQAVPQGAQCLIVSANWTAGKHSQMRLVCPQLCHAPAAPHTSPRRDPTLRISAVPALGHPPAAPSPAPHAKAAPAVLCRPHGKRAAPLRARSRAVRGHAGRSPPCAPGSAQPQHPKRSRRLLHLRWASEPPSSPAPRGSPAEPHAAPQRDPTLRPLCSRMRRCITDPRRAPTQLRAARLRGPVLRPCAVPRSVPA